MGGLIEALNLGIAIGLVTGWLMILDLEGRGML